MRIAYWGFCCARGGARVPESRARLAVTRIRGHRGCARTTTTRDCAAFYSKPNTTHEWARRCGYTDGWYCAKRIKPEASDEFWAARRFTTGRSKRKPDSTGARWNAG